jgi:hypothetical protein
MNGRRRNRERNENYRSSKAEALDKYIILIQFNSSRGSKITRSMLTFSSEIKASAKSHQKFIISVEDERAKVVIAIEGRKLRD